MLRGLTGTPMRRIDLAKRVFAEADPEPFTLANFTTKSLTDSIRFIPALSPEGDGAILPAMRHRIGFCTAKDGVRLAFSVGGKGHPILLVKSFWGHVENDASSPIWRHWIAALAELGTLVRYDARGTGLSDHRVQDYCFDTLVGDAEAVVDHLGLKQFAVVSLTGGAPIAIALAARRPGAVTRLVLHAGYVRGRSAGEDASRALVSETFVELVRGSWEEPRSVARRMLVDSFIPDAPVDIQEAFDRGALESAGGDDAARIARANYEMDVRAQASKVRCPVLNLQPVHNHLLLSAPGSSPLDEGRLLATCMPQTRLVPLESRNHILLEHEPAWQHWRTEVQAFLSSRPSPGPFSLLSPREAEVARLLASGLDNAQIAAQLSISEKTVRNHITRIFAKLQVTTRSQAIVLAHEAGVARSPLPC